MTDRDSMVMYVEHEGGGMSAIPNPRAHRDGGLCWRLRYAPSDASVLSAASVIDTFTHLLDPHITAKDACARLRELRREYGRLAKLAENTMTDQIELAAQASIEADSCRDMLEEGNFIEVKDFGGEVWAVFSHSDECRVQAILDLADLIRRRREPAPPSPRSKS